MGIMELFALTHMCIGVTTGILSAVITAKIIKDKEK